MAEELRLALVLLGSLAIGAVILHGIWTVRKTVNEEKQKTKLMEQEQEPEPSQEEKEVAVLKLKQMEMDFATLGTNQNEDGEEAEGLPVADINLDSIYSDKGSSESSSPKTDKQQPDLASVQAEQEDPVEPKKPSEEPTLAALDSELDSNELSLSVEQEASPSEDIGSFSALDHDDSPSKLDVKIETNQESKEEQMPLVTMSAQPELDLQPEPDIESETVPQEQPKSETQKPIEPEKQEVLILFVDKPDGDPIEGAKLLPMLLTLGFKFGEMDFFHRHQTSAGQGDVLFSLANMYNPGTFDVDNMEQMNTRGLTIFMTLPNAGEALQTFNMMHNAAKKIADEFGAKVLDHNRTELDVAIVRNYVERIRKF